MSENDKVDAPEVKAPEVTEKKEEKPEEKTVGEALGQDPKPKVSEEEKPNVIPESVFLGEKKARKAAEKRVKELETLIKSGATDEEIGDDIKSIAAEHNIDEGFLSKLTKSIENRIKSEADARISSALRPIEEREKQKELDTTFQRLYKTSIERMPEYERIVNPEVIKSLSLDPRNKDKTVSQLIEETYGNALGGKRTIETTKPRGGKEPEGIDFERARKDSTYFHEIMSNPDLKKEYNNGLTDRLQNHL